LKRGQLPCDVTVTTSKIEQSPDQKIPELTFWKLSIMFPLGASQAKVLPFKFLFGLDKTHRTALGSHQY